MTSKASSNSHSGKKGIDKINESMNKIGAMLGVNPSTSSDDSKKEPFIRSDSDDKSEGSAQKLIRNMNSAEGNVIGPPTMKTHSHGEETEDSAVGGSQQEAESYMTKPTAPGKTKTAAGAAVASFAAAIDNTASRFTRSFRKAQDGACTTRASDTADVAEEGRAKGVVSADGTTTKYVSADKEGSEFSPSWTMIAGMSTLIALIIIAIIAAVDGSPINQALRDFSDRKSAASEKNLTVAFIGNSYIYVNDIPRIMEAISDHRIHQDSVINTAAGLGSLLKQGNGMYYLWQTPNALDVWDSFDFQQTMENYGIDEDFEFYDWGKCTVPQLINGYDNYLSYKNKNGAYLNYGNNPCFQEPNYMTILQQRAIDKPEFFDFIILNDQTRRMTDEDARDDSLDALAQAYSVLIKNARAVPILIDTHAYPFAREEGYNVTDEENEEGEEQNDDAEAYNEYMEYMKQQYYENKENGNANWQEGYNSYWGDDEEEEVFFGDDMGRFTSAIYAGLYEYIDVLEYNLPESQKPRIAKIGMTYLAIREDNKSMWKKLFADDMVHASPYGSYLFSVVLYATMYGHLPKPVDEPMDVKSLFWMSRTVFGNQTEYPTVNEANYLRRWARRVQLNGYIPKTMSLPTPLEYPEEEEMNMTEYYKNQGQQEGEEENKN